MIRLKDLDMMKGLTIILVIWAHATRMFSQVGVIKVGYSPVLETVTQYIYMFHMPAFVAVTGAVYYFLKREKGKYKNQKEFIKDKAIRLLIPFFFISFFFVIPVKMYTGLNNNLFELVFHDIIRMNSSTHLWYSMMIFNVFVFFNFFEKIIYKNSFFVNSIIFLFIQFLAKFIPVDFGIGHAAYYAFYFYMGYAFQQKKEGILLKVENKFSLFFLMTIVGYIILFYSPLANIFLIADFIKVIVAISGIMMIYIVSLKMSGTKLGDNSLLNDISEMSYGLYLFHPMIIYLLSYWAVDLPLKNTTLVLGISLAAFLLSICLVKIFRNLNLQLFIGEKVSRHTEAKALK